MHIPSSGARYLGMLVLVFLNPGVNGQTTIDEVPAVAASIPAPAHVIVVMEENHGYAEIIGSGQAPYINTLATQGALFTNSFAITHPSQPNYLALFSGSSMESSTIPARTHSQGDLWRACCSRLARLSRVIQKIFPRWAHRFAPPESMRASTLRGRTSPETLPATASLSATSPPIFPSCQPSPGSFRTWTMTCTMGPFSKEIAGCKRI